MEVRVQPRANRAVKAWGQREGGGAAVGWPDQQDLLKRIRGRSASTVEFDAQKVAEALFGESTEANILLIGAAYQAGGIDLPAESIEKAIALNGVAVAANIAAFRWGRAVVAQPARVPGLRIAAEPDRDPPSMLVDTEDLEGETRRIVDVRVPELVAYQGKSCAEETSVPFAGRGRPSVW